MTDGDPSTPNNQTLDCIAYKSQQQTTQFLLLDVPVPRLGRLLRQAAPLQPPLSALPRPQPVQTSFKYLSEIQLHVLHAHTYVIACHPRKGQEVTHAGSEGPLQPDVRAWPSSEKPGRCPRFP